jgi:3D (Asp-Asp-Asp) domain-containing protein
MKKGFLLLLIALFVSGCANTQKAPQRQAAPVMTGKLQKVRTTAYTHTEKGGSRNAIGQRLKSGKLNSAASDWSRFPVGTRFKIINTGEICQIDDYGSALVGTNTIDLYKTSRASMNRWGVRYVDIEILEWGSPSKSLEVLTPRVRNRHVRQMVLALRQQTPAVPQQFRKVNTRS